MRKKGLAKALKKSSRIANEGAVGIFFDQDKTLLIEINTETDFVAKNDLFLNFIEQIANYALQIQNEIDIDINNFMKKEFDGRKISDFFTEIISKIGENVVLRRLKLFNADSNVKIFILDI